MRVIFTANYTISFVNETQWENKYNICEYVMYNIYNTNIIYIYINYIIIL